jgi:NADH:ubiquinone oxidoreductase subunit 5 (subunit L)/multisubunit Na+/H+ antiporter MnhA subunit
MSTRCFTCPPYKRNGGKNTAVLYFESRRKIRRLMLFHTLNIIFFLFFLSCVAFVLCLLFSSTRMSLVVNISIFKLSGLSVSFPFLFDRIGILFCALVCFISANVIMFSVVYMSNELFITRFT